jgi:hypothetical protein
MFVGEQNGFYFLAIGSQHLLSKIWSAIYYKRKIIPQNQNRNPQSLVFWVGAFANRMVASDYRNALRSACTQKIDFQNRFIFYKNNTKIF